MRTVAPSARSSPKPIATAMVASWATPKPWTSSSHAANVMKINSAPATIRTVAARKAREGRFQSMRAVLLFVEASVRIGSRNTAATTNSRAIPIAQNGAVQSNEAINQPAIGAPTRNDNAHDSSSTPSERPRRS